MAPLEKLSQINFLSVCDVAMDIMEKTQMSSGDTVYIPIIRSIIRFPVLLPAKAINLMDEYAGNRARATNYLKESGAILDREFQSGSHRWDSKIKITLDGRKFEDFYTHLTDVYQRRVVEPAAKPSATTDEEAPRFRIEGYSDENLSRIDRFIQIFTNQSELDGWSRLTRLIKLPVKSLEREGYIHAEARVIVKTINEINGEKLMEIINDEVYGVDEKPHNTFLGLGVDSDLEKSFRKHMREQKLESWLAVSGAIYNITEEDLENNLILRFESIAPFGTLHALQEAIKKKLSQKSPPASEFSTKVKSRAKTQALKNIIEKSRQAEIDEMLTERRESRNGRNKKQNRFPDPLPAGTDWQNFTLRFIDQEVVVVMVGKIRRQLTYAELGFKDNRKKQKWPPYDSQWQLLLDLAVCGGEITPDGPYAKPENEKAKENLSKKLKEYFAIPYDPFLPVDSEKYGKKRGSYKIRLTLIPPPEDKGGESVDDFTRDIRESYQDETPSIGEN